MNPQMQNYQRYAQQQQSRAPNARRPGECAPSTSLPLIAPGRVPYPQMPQFPPNFNPSLKSFIPDCDGGQPVYLHPFGHGAVDPAIDLGYPDPTGMQGNYHHQLATPPATPPSVRRSLPRLTPTPVLRRGTEYTADMIKQLRFTAENRFLRQKIYERLSHPALDLYAYFCREIGPPQNPNVAAQQHQQQLYQQQMAQRNAALEHQLAQRRARKPTDRNMPDGVEDLVVGEGVQQYKDLREVEKKLDYAIMRKRLDIQDTMNRNVKRQKTMRIWVSNTVDSQPWQRPALDENSFDFESGADATYRVKIEGKILDEQEDELDSDAEQDGEGPDAAKPNKKLPQSKKFSHYFKGISVEFDKARNLPNPNVDPSMQIDWKKTPQSGEFDCFEFQRKGDENQNITISLQRDEPVERYRLSKALSDVLDIEEADRAEVVMGIWEYVKAMGLQEDEERRHVRCDERLRAVSMNQLTR